MSSFQVEPGAMHRNADQIGDIATQVARAAKPLARLDPGNPDFTFSAAISTVLGVLADRTGTASEVVSDLAEKVHATATAYQRTEESNTLRVDV